VRRTELRKH